MPFTVADQCNCSQCKEERRMMRRSSTAAVASPRPFFSLPDTQSEPVKRGPKYVLTPYDLADFHSDPTAMCGDEIGSGAYGNVFKCTGSDDYVIKKFNVADGYPVWMAFAALEYRRGSGSALLPRIYGVSMPADNNDAGYVIMERLDKTLSAAVTDTRYDDPIRVVCNLTRDVSDWITHVAEDTAMISRGMYKGNEQTPFIARVLKQAQKHLPAVIVDATACSVPLGSDAHAGNWMFRDTGELVLTDPFVVRWGTDEREAGLQAAAQYARDTCKKANMFTPGFYSEYSRKRVVNMFM